MRPRPRRSHPTRSFPRSSRLRRCRPPDAPRKQPGPQPAGAPEAARVAGPPCGREHPQRPVPLGLPRPGHRVRPGCPVPVRGRRPRHRLECHRAPRGAVPKKVHRGEGGDAAPGPRGLAHPGLRFGRAIQEGGAPRARGARDAPRGRQRRPRRIRPRHARRTRVPRAGPRPGRDPPRRGIAHRAPRPAAPPPAPPAGPGSGEPVRGRGAILHAAASLIGRPAPPLGRAEPEIPWRFISRAAPKHSVLLWLGDFPPRPEPEGWAVLSRRYQTMGFRVDDPWERKLPAEVPITAYDPSAGRLVTLEGSQADRSAHAEWRSRRDAAWESLFPRPLSRLVVSTSDDRFDALVRFFHARMRTGASRGRW